MPARFNLSTLPRRRSAKFALALLMAIAVITLVTFTARAWRSKAGSIAQHAVAQAQPTPARNRSQGRLALQPEADKQRRRLGQRFQTRGREVSTLVGTLIVGSERHTARITRSQDNDDERLMISLSGLQGTFTWSGLDGAKSNGNAATSGMRTIIERLALDAPDQFILAQLRGAAYFTVERAVRPAEAGGR